MVDVGRSTVCGACHVRSACRYHLQDEPSLVPRISPKGRSIRFRPQSAKTTALPPGDQEYRRKAMDSTRSILVRAPAGSGKTTLLAKRYVEILRHENVEPENIICLTFTVKAAGEMKRRIRTEIEEFLNTNRDCATERLARYLKPGHSSRLRVQTIDAFHRSLVLGDSLLAGVMPRFRSAASRDHYYKVVRDEIANLKSPEKGTGGAVDESILTRWSVRSLQHKMVEMLRRRDGWMREVERGGKCDNGRAGSAEAWSVLSWLASIANNALDSSYSMEREYDHIAISQAATKLVGTLDVSDLTRISGGTIRHVLIDEMQDLSKSQLEFFEELVDKNDNDWVRTIFAVGDSMQSIYMFRGAGIEVILGMFQGTEATDSGDDEVDGRSSRPKLGNRAMGVVGLSENFRSAQSIVDGVAELLAERLPASAKSGGQNLRKARLLRGVRGRDTRPREGEAGVVLKAFKNLMSEGKWVAETLERYRDNPDHSEELAVLVRSRNQYYKHIEPHLRDSTGIEVGFRRIDRQACINDMMVLVRCLENASESTWCLALLRSPLLGMNSKQIYYAYLQANGDDSTPLKRWLLGGGPEGDEVSADSRRKLDRFRVAYWRSRTEMIRLPARCWLERAWFRVGGGEIYGRREDIVNIETFLDLVDDVSGGGRFVNWTELEKRLRNIEGTSESSVKVMTIHKAKGLEFDTVIVPFLGDPGTQEAKRDLVLLGTGQDGTCAYLDGDGANTEEREGYEIERDKLTRRFREEGRNLLYVAATRAKTKCWLTVSRPCKNGRWDAKAVIRRIDTPAEGGVERYQDLKTLMEEMRFVKFEDLKEGTDDCASGVACKVPKASGSAAKENAVSVAVAPTGGNDAAARAVVSSSYLDDGTGTLRLTGRGERDDGEPRADPVATAIGEVIHDEIGEMLLSGRRLRDDRFDDVWLNRCRRALRRRLGGVERGRMDVETAVRTVRVHLERVCKDRFMRRLAVAAASRRAGWTLDLEKSFHFRDEDKKWKTKRVDVLLRNDRKFVIVEFKTGRVCPKHEQQVNAYRGMVERAFTGSSVGVALYYTAGRHGSGIGGSGTSGLEVVGDEGSVIERLLSGDENVD